MVYTLIHRSSSQINIIIILLSSPLLLLPVDIHAKYRLWPWIPSGCCPAASAISKAARHHYGVSNDGGPRPDCLQNNPKCSSHLALVPTFFREDGLVVCISAVRTRLLRVAFAITGKSRNQRSVGTKQLKIQTVQIYSYQIVLQSVIFCHSVFVVSFLINFFAVIFSMYNSSTGHAEQFL